MTVLQNSQKFQVLWQGRTEPTEDPGTGMNVPHTELTKVLGTGNARLNTHPLGGEFDSKRRTQSILHVMFSLGQCPRGNLPYLYRREFWIIDKNNTERGDKS